MDTLILFCIIILITFFLYKTYKEIMPVIRERRYLRELVTNEMAYCHCLSLNKSGKYAEAIHHIDTLSSFSTNLIYKCLIKGDAYYMLGQYNDAFSQFLDGIQNFRTYGKNIPTNEKEKNYWSKLNIGAGKSQCMLKQYEVANTYFENHGKYIPNEDGEYWMFRGDCYFAMKEYFKAIKAYQASIRNNRQPADTARLPRIESQIKLSRENLAALQKKRVDVYMKKEFVFCPYCGSKSDANADSCEKCGASLK